MLFTFGAVLARLAGNLSLIRLFDNFRCKTCASQRRAERRKAELWYGNCIWLVRSLRLRSDAGPLVRFTGEARILVDLEKVTTRQ
jgi:hypothetical protein